MAVTDAGMTVVMMPSCSVLVLVLMMALQFSRESYTVFSGSTVTEVSEEQLQNALKALSPIVVNPSGKVTDFKPVHPLKAYSLMVFTALGMTISCRLAQPKKALVPMLVICGGRTMERRFLQV